MKTLSRISSFLKMLCLFFYSMGNDCGMKVKSRFFLLGIVVMPSLLFVPLCDAALINGGFETGDISGWTLRSEGGYWEHWVFDSEDNLDIQTITPSHALLEQIGFFQQFSPNTVTYKWYGNYSPTEGQYFLEMQNANRGGIENYFQHPDGSEYVYFGDSTLFLEQSFYIEKGDILSGTAAFSTEDFCPYITDQAKVDINNTTIWTKGVIDVDTLSLDGHSEWENWSWVAPESKTYTISLTIFTDDDLGSWGMFDNIKITHVPEPTSMLLLGIGLIGLVGLRKIFKI